MSFSERQTLLNLLHNVLTDPGSYGDKFLVEMLKRSTDGLISITILQNMVSALNDYPIGYIVHCISKDEEDRFKQSIDGTKVGLKSHPFNLETNEFGFMEHKEAHSEKTDSKIHNSPQSVYSVLTNLEEISQTRTPVMPVVYIDGKFYVDEDAGKTLTSLGDLATQQYNYDKVDIPPLGLRGELDPFKNSLPQCFNCNGDHMLKDCTIPINKFKVAENRKKRLKDSTSTGRRLYAELDLRDKISTAAPGVLSDVLREALGMREGDQPPYYKNMRANGYPPGYLGKDGYQIPHGSKMNLEDVINKKAPILKVYGADEIVSTLEEEEQSHFYQNNTHDVELVYYPGLNLINTSNLDRKMENQVATNLPITSHNNIQKQWEIYNRQQEEYYYYPQYAYPTQDQMYPPGTAENPNQESYNNTFATNTPISNSSFMMDQRDNKLQNSNIINDNNQVVSSTIENDESDDMDISSDDES